MIIDSGIRIQFEGAKSGRLPKFEEPNLKVGKKATLSTYFEKKVDLNMWAL